VGDKISGLNLWHEGFSNSNYAKTSDEYTGTNGQLLPSVSYGGYIVDTTLASGGSKTSAILAEVCKVISNPVADGYYPVYVVCMQHFRRDEIHLEATKRGGRLHFALY